MSDTALRPLTQAEARAVARFAPHPTLFARTAVAGVAAASRVLMRHLNHLEVAGADRLAAARRTARGLLTFSNHVSLFDDPWLTACLTDDLRWERVRWVAADALNFFGNPLTAPLFNGGRCVPIVRGIGANQPGMTFLAERLVAGDWVHVFPEGGRTRAPDAALQLPFKAGMADLIRQAAPLALPWMHRGMQAVLPLGARWPAVGRRVEVWFGEVTDTALGLAAQSTSEITRWAEAALTTLAADGPPRPHTTLPALSGAG